jgi:hypothetical protein
VFKQLKQNGCQLACRAARRVRLAPKNQVGAHAREGSGNRSENQPPCAASLEHAWFPRMWEKSGLLDQKSDSLNRSSEKHQHFLDSLFYNVDLITKINNSLPLNMNGLIELFVGIGLGQTLFSYFWDQLTPLGGEVVRSVAGRGGGRLISP